MPVRFLILVLLICFVANSLPAKERTLKYEHYAVNNGLPSHTVYAAHEDLQGFLWICTDAGVSRFDGNTFTNFSVNDGLGDNEIVDLRVDSKGRIWFFPFSGSLSYYYQGIFHNIKNDTLLQRLNTAMSLTDLVEDQHHDLYFLSKLRPQTLIILRHNNTIEELDFKQQLQQHYFYHHFIIEGGEVILFASNGVLYNLHKKELTRCHTDPNMPGVDNYYPEQQTANYWFDHEGLKRLHHRHPTLLIPAYRLPNLDFARYATHHDFL